MKKRSEIRGQRSEVCALLLALCAMLSAPCFALNVSVTNQVTNIQPTSADFGGNVTSTNGSTNVVSLRLCYGTSDGLTNLNWWGYTNPSFTVASTGSFSTNITGLAPTTRYYSRWFASQGTNTAWSATSNFWTLATAPIAPTSTPPAAPYIPVMLDAGNYKSVNWDPLYGPTSMLIGYDLSPTNIGLYPWGCYMFMQGSPERLERIDDNCGGSGMVGYHFKGSMWIGDHSYGALQRGVFGGPDEGIVQINASSGSDQIGYFAGSAYIYGGGGWTGSCHQWLYQEHGLAVINVAHSAIQLGYMASGIMTNSTGDGSIQIMSGAGTNVMTGNASLGIGNTVTCTNDQAIVLGDGNQSHGDKSITAGSFWVGDTNIVTSTLDLAGTRAMTWCLPMGGNWVTNAEGISGDGSFTILQYDPNGPVEGSAIGIGNDGGIEIRGTTTQIFLYYQSDTNFVRLSSDLNNYYLTRCSNGVVNVKTNSMFP
jgi:hypothetical protein